MKKPLYNTYMNIVLYYSNYCTHSKDLLYKLSRCTIEQQINYICIDIRRQEPGGTIVIISSDGTERILNKNIKKVPSILLPHNGDRVITGNKPIYEFIQTFIKKNKILVDVPLAYSIDEMGATLSDKYSYLDTSPDELLAKGNGGLRLLHNYTAITQHNTIETPPEDYIPDKVGTVDLEKLQQVRNADTIITPN
jgi:hypothetical protein